MSATSINLLGPSYSDLTKPFSVQETINWVPEAAEAESRNVAMLREAPGLTKFAEAGSGPIRGMSVFEGDVYAVSGISLYKIDVTGTATQVGTGINGSEPVSMAQNGFELVIVNGANGWYWDGTTFAQITDPDFQPANTVTFIDQYLAFDGNDGQFFISELADGKSFRGTDFATAESAPDDTIAVLNDHLELWVFGESSIEIWNNTGNPDFPFQRNSGTVIERGLGAIHSIAKMDNTVYWLGEDGVVYAANGYTPQRISTHAIEQHIQSAAFSDAYAFNFRDKGHWFYCITVNGKTFLYDAATQMWHRRKHYSSDQWKVAAYAFAYNKRLFGSSEDGRVFELDDDNHEYDGEPKVCERTTQYIHDSQNPVFCRTVELVMETGVGLNTGQGSDPTVDMRYSDDGGRNYTDFRQMPLGEIGEYTNRIVFRQLGRIRQSRAFHIRISDPVKRNLIAASARMEKGRYT